MTMTMTMSTNTSTDTAPADTPAKTCSNCKYWGYDWEGACAALDTDHPNARPGMGKAFLIVKAADDTGLEGRLRTDAAFFCAMHVPLHPPPAPTPAPPPPQKGANVHTELSPTLKMSNMMSGGSKGFWLYDKTQGMNLAMRAPTERDAFVEALAYYQRTLSEVEARHAELRGAVDVFVGRVVGSADDGDGDGP
jgi:hypothetical protein